MPRLMWDQVGERRFQTGIDRGVLYISDTVAVPWNGLTGFDEAVNREVQSYYQDGIKYMEHHVLGEYGGTLKAFTYPDEFEECVGITSKGNGLQVYDQRPKTFGLTYRTKLGDDVDPDAGYLIHILYNLRAIPGGVNYASQTDQTTPVEFTWEIGSTPEVTDGYRPTAHVAIKSTDIDTGLLDQIEGLLYGTPASIPYLPSLGELISIVDNPLVVVDNLDGTWTVTGSDSSVTLLNPGVFQIQGLNVIYQDADRHEFLTT